MTAHDDAILRLAEIHGFETQWHDFMGRHRQVGLDTLRSLLRAEGVEISDPAGGLAEAVEVARRAPLAPRLTGTAGGVLHIALALDCPQDRDVPWRIEFTDGRTLEGTAIPSCGEPDPLLGQPRPGLALPLPTTPGEARLLLGGAVASEARLTIAPPACFRGALEDRRLWGLGVQLYGLRAAGAGGLGHFGALPALARAAAARGANALALSPTHALFAADPQHYSPYAPSSRTRLNGWLADPGGLPEAGQVATLSAALGLDAALASAEEEEEVHYPTAVPLRLSLLRALHAGFAAAHLAPPTSLGEEFLAFRRAGGAALEDHARFEALHACQFRDDPSAWDWRRWPEALRDPRNDAVARFAAAHANDVAFHVFLQWLATRQLRTAQETARAAGMAIGLVTDLAVGTHAGGSRAWSRTAALLEGVSIGAPPDLLNPHGQDWGLTTFAPARLAAQGFAPFIEDLGAAMAHAGGVRIDHVMGLARIWCVPEGERASHGAYLRFPVDDLMRIMAAESHRHGTVVIGEDLGTLPHGYRDTLVRNHVLGLRVLFFERDSNGGFAPPARYSAEAVATSTTHDMPTLAGWWRGADIGLRAGLGLLPEGSDEAAEHRTREGERSALWHALRTEAGAEGDRPDAPDERLGAAVAHFLGQAPSALVMLPIEDALLVEPQVNLPGTTEEHPNWRRRLPRAAEVLLAEAPATGILDALAASRRKADRR
ncbi:4-alpha-glucanotransferase [Roseomonas sp. HF4]|uniref:4-alpha-glucanotransferase n=1 Tax=Roseomonas sp. HF4 TaxID=2562313 RepID=UPI0010C03CF4|nr:4-alpha-glucanotransferase [Roseomonas sp. HF4]